jgi:hypothetical protein
MAPEQSRDAVPKLALIRQLAGPARNRNRNVVEALSSLPEASPASCQRTTGEGLKNGSDGDHQRREPGPAFKSGPRHGFDVGQEGADEDGWPDALPEDQDGGKGNAGRWIEWRDVAGGMAMCRASSPETA